MKIFLIATLFLAGCSTMSNTPTANGQFVATYDAKGLGADSSTAVTKVMEVAQKQCGTQQVKVVNLTNTGAGIARFPNATLVYECN